MITDTIPLFPQGLICCNLGLDNDRLINLIERDLNYDLEGSAYYLTHESNLHEQEDYAWFTSSIQEQVQQVFDDVYEYVDVEPYITEMWGTVCEHGNFVHSHTHPNSFMSGVYYPEDADNAPIRFHNPLVKTLQPAVKFDNLYNMNSFVLCPQRGTLILFPSYLQHETKPWLADDVRRYSVAFNVFIRGTVGHDALASVKLS